ncbi:hypothetical protein B0H15DRAFT_860190 [Mycena belliarum]|uniref:F-box domain-containing protein n=1 Tax=Mycena belliarum TaxID=1033014 RepID=A0AAD6TT29_9AGAR|nr:hypothetical protein B0H15DRAFT_860190 [Mycena belliae]
MNSIFATKLKTNYVPSDAEVEEIHNALIEPLQQLALLDDRIARMQEAMDELIAERAWLKGEIEDHKALISPIRRVPQDVLETIFTACLPKAHNALINAREAPLLLGHICSYWQGVAHSMPTLWTSIYIPSASTGRPQAPAAVVPRFAEIVQEWFGRSGTGHLSLSMTLDGIQPALAQPLRSVFRRLRHLEVGIYSEAESVAAFLRGGNNEFPALESLNLHTREDAGPVFWSTVELLAVSSLRRVSLQLRGDPMTLPLLWGELTELNMQCFMSWPTNDGDWELWEGGMRAHDVVDILRRCQNLVKCRLDVTRVEAFQSRASATVPYLESLTIRECGDIPEVMESLSLPCLRHLSLDLSHGAACNEEHFLRAITPHTELLTSIDFTIRLFSHETLLAFLRLVPGLRKIRLRRGRGLFSEEDMPSLINDAILRELTPTAANPGLCPLLTEFEIHRCAFFSDDTLAQFIVARMNSEYPLIHVVVDFGRTVDRALGPELERWTAEGALSLRLDYVILDAWKYHSREGLSMLNVW